VLNITKPCEHVALIVDQCYMFASVEAVDGGVLVDDWRKLVLSCLFHSDAEDVCIFFYSYVFVVDLFLSTLPCV
jgi:hypothetical protein